MTARLEEQKTWILEDTLASIDAVMKLDAKRAEAMSPEDNIAELGQIMLYGLARWTPVATELARRRGVGQD